MKKALIALLLLASVLALSFSALGETTSYTIEEFDLTVEIPEGYCLITPDIAPDDPLLEMYGMSAEDVANMFDMMPLYMDAVKADGTGEITVTIQDTELPDYNLLDETTLKTLLDEMSAQSGEMGIDIIASDICEFSGIRFTRSCFESDLLMDCGVQYYTVLDGHSYSFAMHVYGDTLPEADGALMENFVRNAKFNAYDPEAAAQTPPIPYVDQQLGLSFTVPAGWEYADVAPRSGVQQAAFVSALNPARNIVYVAADIWPEYSSLEKLFCTRSGVDNSSLSSWDVAEMFGVSASAVERVTINGNEYYSAEIDQTVSKQGVTIEVTSTALLRIQDAKTYMFLYTDGGSGAQIDDFNEMIESVVYPEPAPRGVAPILIILPVVLIIAALIIVFSVRARRERQRKAEEAAEAARKARLAELLEEEARRAREAEVPSEEKSL